MRIVCLDSYTATNGLPQDNPLAPIAALGDFTEHDHTPAELTVERSGDADAVITNKTLLKADVLTELPDLRYIGLLSTGTNVVDLDTARAQGITVTNVPGYSTDSVAQHIFALMLHFASRAADHHASVAQGDWPVSRDFSYLVAPLTELAGKTLAIVGLGAIGSATARIGHAFGMRVTTVERPHRTPAVAGVPLEVLPMDELLASADYLSLSCPLSRTTYHLIDAAALAKMKPTAVLINTGRGPLIDEGAVAQALHDGKLGGLGVDVLSSEPPETDHPVLSAPNTVITPHIAWATTEARTRLIDIVANNLAAWQRGEPVNVVS
ncbi:MAG: D-2-hydroxyacid dehydrogenase [Planctomycetota bacterium]